MFHNTFRAFFLILSLHCSIHKCWPNQEFGSRIVEDPIPKNGTDHEEDLVGERFSRIFSHYDEFHQVEQHIFYDTLTAFILTLIPLLYLIVLNKPTMQVENGGRAKISRTLRKHIKTILRGNDSVAFSTLH